MRYLVILCLAGCLSWDSGNPGASHSSGSMWIHLTCHADECYRQAEQICHHGYDIDWPPHNFDNSQEAYYQDLMVRCK
jgi:hypothetical protein